MQDDQRGTNRQGRQGRQGVRGPEPSAALDAVAHAVIGAALEVHSVLGPGYLESTYEEALAVELGLRSIPFVRQAPLSISYKRKVVGQQRIDLLVDGDLVVELKAVESFLPIHVAQVMSYLKAGAFDLALLINFNVPRLKDGIRRVFWFP